MKTVSDRDLARYERFSAIYERYSEKWETLAPRGGIVLLLACIGLILWLGRRSMVGPMEFLTALMGALLLGSFLAVTLIAFSKAFLKVTGRLLRFLIPSVRRVDQVRHEQHEQEMRYYEAQHEQQIQRLGQGR